VKLATAEQMRRIDAAAMDKYAIPGMVLMENAGRQVAAAVEAWLEAEPGARVLVICGKGNNGGDGFVAARHLQNRGANVQVTLLCDAGELGGDAAANCQIAQAMGVPMDEDADGAAVRVRTARADIIVDAILGTGISGEVRGVAREAIEAISQSPARVVAVDIPSGIHADTGEVLGAAVKAETTVTFGLPKLGQVLHPGAGYCGELRVVDISLPRRLLSSDSLLANLVTAELATAMLPPRRPDMHKGDAGHVLVLAGSAGMTGAAALCATAAARAGAGLVTVGCPASLQDILASKCTETMTLGLPETEARSLSARAAGQALEFAGRCEAVALGPGLSQHPETAELVRAVVSGTQASLVVDADALNCLGGATELLAGRQGATVITPHPGELARLLGTGIGAIQADRVRSARRAAQGMDCVVVLKGAATVVAEPGGEVWINGTGNHGMASGGMGDVLTGVVAAFLAGGCGPVEAAVAGVYFHGLAADEAAREGARGLLAGDVVEALRKALG
jgi:ADP-dependent NAD(P)H-hydrate dehydratase / NAD(P)H-hydrate epimerase